MRIEQIAENKIKIVINNDDIKKWNVDLKNFTDNTPEAQDMFWFALKRAEQDVDFTVGRSQLLVETRALDDDGFVMEVSRIENENELSQAFIKMGRKITQTEVRLRRRQREESLYRIFKFSDFEDMCRGVKEISELYLGSSKVFKYLGDFYLELKPIDSFGLFEIENILSEFSEKSKNPTLLEGVLTEHGKIMIDRDAVAVITKNFIIG